MERTRLPVNVIRYADNLVVLHSDDTVIRQCQELLTPWLQSMGLQLHPTKTQITHTLHPYEGTVGFDFLGFNIRQHAVSKRKCVQGYKTLIKPSTEAIHRHVVHLRTLVRAHKSQPQVALIDHLNPVIRGWSQFYSTVVSSDTFRKLDYILFHQLWAWAKRSNHHYKAKRISRKYWKTEGQRHWVFKATNGARLCSHAATKIRRFVKVRGTKSPLDGDLIYWASRLGHHPECTRTVASLLRAQRGRCAWCGLHFKSDDLWEVDHIIPTSHGGRETYDNRQLLHGHCHDQKTAQDLAVLEARTTPS
jgi:RNA-directed DNA polymerase